MLQQVTFKITLQNENGDTTADSPIRWAVASLAFFVSQCMCMYLPSCAAPNIDQYKSAGGLL
ncbi:hypothetical protein M404DRAFT_25302 [Pisolithus tinctorius Marx 270]|uniref:Uncharacterized protein n=1 Tax=Pisolithus tinctorius Marx 270 TaxID=870435 RepID=A0A0C3K7J4_PISTI|nr:hypothetical protein M404DRAFT_25302 [Pisolithus tinctorius Marx 270]